MEMTSIKIVFWKRAVSLCIDIGMYIFQVSYFPKDNLQNWYWHCEFIFLGVEWRLHHFGKELLYNMYPYIWIYIQYIYSDMSIGTYLCTYLYISGYLHIFPCMSICMLWNWALRCDIESKSENLPNNSNSKRIVQILSESIFTCQSWTHKNHRFILHNNAKQLSKLDHVF